MDVKSVFQWPISRASLKRQMMSAVNISSLEEVQEFTGIVWTKISPLKLFSWESEIELDPVLPQNKKHPD